LGNFFVSGKLVWGASRPLSLAVTIECENAEEKDEKGINDYKKLHEKDKEIN
jgi:hypothetical protein